MYWRIERQVLINQEANPYDPSWEPYYEARLQAKMRATLLGRETLRELYERQGGRCLRCGDMFGDPSDWHVHHRHWRVYGGGSETNNLELLHAHCHRQLHQQGIGNEGAASCEGRL